MTKLSETIGVAFDGVNNPYVPPKQLKISPKLKLHRDAAEDIDPVTFEVIRHNLWNINEEHGATIQRISGSPVAMYALDPVGALCLTRPSCTKTEKYAQ